MSIEKGLSQLLHPVGVLCQIGGNLGYVIPFLNKRFSLTKTRFVVAQFIALLHAGTLSTF